MNRSSPFFYFCLITIWNCSVFSATSAGVVSQTVGSVGETILSSRDVQIQACLERVLAPSKDSSGTLWEEEKNSSPKKKKPDSSKAPKTQELFETQLGDGRFQGELSSTLLEVVTQKEALSFGVAELTEEELKAALQKIEKSVQGKTYWSQLEVGPRELQDFVKRKLTAKKFIKIKTDSMTAIVTDAEAQNYYEKNRLKFGQMPFSNFKDNIKSFLAQQQLQDRLRSWFEAMKRKYKVRNFLSEGKANL